MSELDDIKARAAERRDTWEFDHVGDGGVVRFRDLWEGAEADLDRAIAGWEGAQEAFNLMMDERVNVSTGREKELEEQLEKVREDLEWSREGGRNVVAQLQKARAAALALRNEIQDDRVRESYLGPKWNKVLADTEWLEEHR